MLPTVASLHWLDVSIIAAYLLVLIGVGVVASRRPQSSAEFIRGRDRFGWLALGFSLMAALNSGLDYVQAPALAYGIGLVYIMSNLSWLVTYPWISRVCLPFYRRIDVYSAYEYLEMRFGLGVRLLGASMFILWRVGWMGAAIYVPGLAVKAATGGDLDVATMVIGLGAVVTFYTMLGGLKAVVWNDVAQFCVMFGGLALVMATVLSQVPGGFAEVWRVAEEKGRLSLTGAPVVGDGTFLSWIRGYLTTEITLVGIVVAVSLSRLTAFTADQVSIQRLQSASSVEDARRSYLVNVGTDVIWIVVLAFVGLALLAFNQHHPFPSDLKNDGVLPYFMHHYFPVGVTGLVVAAIFAASLSSVDSALSACSSVVLVDFYNRLVLRHRGPPSALPEALQARQIWVTRLATLFLGGMMIAIGLNVERMGEIYQAANKLLGAFFGPLFAIFALGMFSRRAHSAGVLVGGLAGLAASCFASFFSEAAWLQSVCGNLFGGEFVAFFRDLSWLWPSTIGVSVALLGGYGASVLLPSRHPERAQYRFAEVMRDPEGKEPAISRSA